MEMTRYMLKEKAYLIHSEPKQYKDCLAESLQLGIAMIVVVFNILIVEKRKDINQVIQVKYVLFLAIALKIKAIYCTT